MGKVLGLLLALGLYAGLAGPPVSAEGGLRIIPVPPGVKPQWQKVQNAPKVFFAPNIPTDVFRYQGRYYLFWSGMWFEGRSLEGPWYRPRKPPKVLGRIHPSYFKTAGRGSFGPDLRQGPPGGMPAGPQPPEAFQPPEAPSKPPGWEAPAESGLAEPIPPADVTHMDESPWPINPEGGTIDPGGVLEAGRQAPDAREGGLLYPQYR